MQKAVTAYRFRKLVHYLRLQSAQAIVRRLDVVDRDEVVGRFPVCGKALALFGNGARGHATPPLTDRVGACGCSLFAVTGVAAASTALRKVPHAGVADRQMESARVVRSASW
jgi:hypothetical protein